MKHLSHSCLSLSGLQIPPGTDSNKAVGREMKGISVSLLRESALHTPLCC